MHRRPARFLFSRASHGSSDVSQENQNKKEPMGFSIETLKSILKEVGAGLRAAGMQGGLRLAGRQHTVSVPALGPWPGPRPDRVTPQPQEVPGSLPAGHR